MMTDTLVIAMRNILLLQLALLALAPEKWEALCDRLYNSLKALQHAIRPKEMDARYHKKGFWEIKI